MGDLWADLVLGQPDFSTQTINEADSKRLFNPSGVVVDRFSNPQRLYVFDGGNNRVLGFSNIANAVCAGSNPAAFPLGADIVLSQADFAHTSCNGDSNFQNYPTLATPNASSLCSVRQDEISPMEAHYYANMAVDGQGDLYVPDYFNNRVLRYEGSALVAGAMGVAASHVWGQPGFTTGYQGAFTSCGTPNNSGLCFTGGSDWGAGVAVDSQGNLWVADSGENRVLRFPNPNAPGPGVPSSTADMVLGQADFMSTTAASSRTDTVHLTNPLAVRVDSAGNVYVVDEPTGGGRLVVYLAPVTSSKAIGFIQTDYMSAPRGLEFDPSGKLWMSDAGTNQALLFNVSPSSPTNFTPGKVLLRSQPWTGSGTPAASTSGDAPDFNYADGGVASSWNMMPPAGGIGVDGAGDVFLTSRDVNFDVWRFPAPVPGAGTLPAGQSHSADWALFKGAQFGMSNEVGPAGLRVGAGVAVAAGQVIVADSSHLRYWNIPSGPGALVNGQAADGTAGVPAADVTLGSTPEFGRIREDHAASPHLWAIRGYNPSVHLEAYNLPLAPAEMPGTTLVPPLPVLGGGSVSWTRVDGLCTDPTDSSGMYLWISDTVGNRVLRVRNPLNPTQAVVDIILGQANATAVGCNGNNAASVLPGCEFCALSCAAGEIAPTASGLAYPGALKMDHHGNLYVSDGALEWAGNNRLLRFNAATIQNASNTTPLLGVAASWAYNTNGNFTAPAPASPSGVWGPWEVAFTGDDSIMVAGMNEYTGSRFPVIYANPASGDSLAAHLGDYTTHAYASTFDDQDNLYMADLNKNRVLVYFQPFLNPLPTSTPTVSPTPDCCLTQWSYAPGNSTFSSLTSGLAYDPSGPGTLYVGGTVTIQAVNPSTGAVWGALPGTYQSANVLQRGRDGYLYVGDYNSQNLYKVAVPSGSRVLTVGFAGYGDRLTALSPDDQSPNEDLYVGGQSSNIYKVTQGPPAAVTPLVFSPEAPAPARSDVSGLLYQPGAGGGPATLYVSDEHNNRLLKYVQFPAGSVTYAYVSTVNTNPIIFPHEILGDTAGNIYVCGASGYAAFDSRFLNNWRYCGGGSVVPDTQGLAIDGIGGVFMGSASDNGALLKVGGCLLPGWTSTPTNTLTATSTWTPTITPTSTLTPTLTPSFTPTVTPTVTPTFTPTSTPTWTPTSTVTSTPTEGCHAPVLYPNPVRAGGRFTLHLAPCDRVQGLRVKIYTPAFRRVLEKEFDQSIRGSDLTLDLTDDWGIPLANGLYYVVVTVNPASGTGRASQRSVAKLLLIR